MRRRRTFSPWSFPVRSTRRRRVRLRSRQRSPPHRDLGRIRRALWSPTPLTIHDHAYVFVREIPRILEGKTPHTYTTCERCDTALYWTHFVKDWLMGDEEGGADLPMLMRIVVHLFCSPDLFTVEDVFGLVLFNDEYKVHAEVEKVVERLVEACNDAEMSSTTNELPDWDPNKEIIRLRTHALFLCES